MAKKRKRDPRLKDPTTKKRNVLPARHKYFVMKWVESKVKAGVFEFCDLDEAAIRCMEGLAEIPDIVVTATNIRSACKDLDAEVPGVRATKSNKGLVTDLAELSARVERLEAWANRLDPPLFRS